MAIRLTRTLVTAWLGCVAAIAAVMIVGCLGLGVLMLEQENDGRFEQLTEELRNHLTEGQLPAAYQHQLQATLQVLGVFRFHLSHDGRAIWHWQQQGDAPVLDTQRDWSLSTTQGQWRLQTEWCYALASPVLWQMWLEIMLPVIVLGLIAAAFGLSFVRYRLLGLERLMRRAHKVGRGQVVYSDSGEWPRMLGLTLDRLQHALADTRQERAQFDSFIRHNVFLDAQTGLGNRMFFDTRLEAILKGPDGVEQGAVMLLQVRDLDRVTVEQGESAQRRLMMAIASTMISAVREFPDVVIARRSHADFALLLPHLTMTETERLANRLMRHLSVLELPECLPREQCLHLGVAHFLANDLPYPIMAEADMALRAAQLQGANTWFMYDRGELPVDKARGSVRWRVLLEEAIKHNSFLLISEPVVQTTDNDIHHYEMLSRLRDEQGQLIPASVFLPMAARCGLVVAIDRQLISHVFKLMKMEPYSSTSCAINLSVETLLQRENERWLLMMLLQYRSFAHRLIIELSEFAVSRHVEALQPVCLRLHRLGVRLTIDQVGQHIVDSDYQRQLPIDFLKLHSSLTHGIGSRLEHQVVVRSLVGGKDKRQPKVFALGVEQQSEWEMFKTLGVYGGQGHLFTQLLASTVVFPR